MLVYDRYNVIYGYGPLERFIATLELASLNRKKFVSLILMLTITTRNLIRTSAQF